MDWNENCCFSFYQTFFISIFSSGNIIGMKVVIPNLYSYLFPQSNTLDKRPRCVKSDSSIFVSTLSLRSRFSGQITGMLSEDGEKLNYVIDQIIESISRSAKNAQKFDEYHNALWTATAMLVFYKGNTIIVFRVVNCQGPDKIIGEAEEKFVYSVLSEKKLNY